jgi:hypothetical protein
MKDPMLSPIEFVVVYFVGMLLSYIAVRIWSSGIFRSYFEERRRHYGQSRVKETTEEEDSGSSREDRFR